MPGYLNPDGSSLVGGLNPSSSGQALKVDANGNLTVSGGGTQTAPSYTRIEDASNSANVLKVNTDGSINVNPSSSSSSTAINDASTPTQKVSVDSSGNLQVKLGLALPAGSNLIGNVKLVDSGGSNQLTIDSSGRIQGNIVQWNGATPGVNNPLITQDQIRGWINNGQGFSATTGKQTAAGSITAGFSVFNPAASGKTLLVYSLKFMVGNTNFNTMNLTTSDPSFASALTAVNNKAGGSASVTNCTFTNTNVTTSGTTVDTPSNGSNTYTQSFSNGRALIIPAGNGLAFYVNLSGANSWCVTADWIEF